MQNNDRRYKHNKQVLLTDVIEFNDEKFRGVYVPNEAYYIYYRKVSTNEEKYRTLYDELVRIEDNNLTYEPGNILLYYDTKSRHLLKLTEDEDKQLNSLLKGVEAQLQVELNFKLGSARELLISIFKQFDYTLLCNEKYSNEEPGLIDPLMIEQLTSEKYKKLSEEEMLISIKIESYWNNIEDNTFKDLETSICEKLSKRKQSDVELGRRELSDYIDLKYGVILRKYIGTLYRRDGNGYAQTTHDDLILQLKNDFGDNFIHDNDLKKAIGYISKRIEPEPNIIKFKNTLYNMETMEPVDEPDKPIFTLLEIPYNYNPGAESTLMKEFLYSSLQRETEEETEEAVEGILQFTGYLFTSGNKHELLPIATGLTGAGKSVFFNIITHIFGKDKISGISLQRLEKDTHASSQFINSHLNIIRDSDTTMITNNTFIKNWTGNEPFSINPKYKEPFDLPGEEVPKPILVCNTMPEFKAYDDAVIRRFLIIEFLVSFTKTGKANPNLEKEILANDEEIEWFIYQSLEAYKPIKDIGNGNGFIFKIGEDETKELIEKHTHPLNHIVSELILKHDAEAYDTEKEINPNGFLPVFTDDLVEAILYISNRDGIDVPVDKHGRINKTTLVKVIRDEFDLHDGEIVRDKQTGKYSVHREYKARLLRWKGRNSKVYPNLIPSNEYQKVLDSIQAEKILTMHQEANPIN